jgi:hypothetical protein
MGNKRKPSVHIRADILVDIIIEVLSADVPLKREWDKDKLEKTLLSKAKKYTLSNRSLLATNEKQRQRANKVASSPNELAMLFAKKLYYARKLLKHVGVTIIKMGSKDWLMVKECSALASQFCEEFDLDIEKGYEIYINQALKRMAKFSLNKVLSVHASICEDYQAILEINKDSNKELTERAHTAYIQALIKRTGISNSYTNIPNKYLSFVKVAEFCNKRGIKVEDYIISQFEAFSFKNGVPDPMQLIGDKALERYTKYAYENGISISKKEEKEMKIDFNKIKNLR